jgi:oligopeptide/dipeptide ABC transporter ATP-binding protein
LLEVAQLRVEFTTQAGVLRAVDGVDLVVDRGTTLALVGESGCGKSTVARAIMGLVRPASGRLTFDGVPLSPLGSPGRHELCRRLQMIFQDPDASLNPRLTLSASIAEPIRLHGHVSARQADQQVHELLERVGLDPSMLNRYPHELSGGQRQRVCVARALALRPELLVCDEAVSALDVSVQAQILNLLIQLQREFGLSYLFITHDLAVVRQIADHIAVMYLGQIVEVGPAARLLDEPQHPYTRALLSAVPSLDPSRAGNVARLGGDVPSPLTPPGGCRFHPRCPDVFDRCATEAPKWVQLGSSRSRCWKHSPATEQEVAPDA